MCWGGGGGRLKGESESGWTNGSTEEASPFAFHADIATIGSRIPGVLNFSTMWKCEEFLANSERLVDLQNHIYMY